MKSLFLTDTEIKKILTMEDTLDAVENAFREKGLGEAQMPPKPYLFYDAGDLRVMPAYLPRIGISGVKVVNVHPENPQRYGLPSVMATILLIDPKTGSPFGLFAGTWITTMRTGASAGIATKYLAREDSKTLALVGAGAQAETQLKAIAAVRRIAKVKVVDRDERVAERFAEEMQKATGIELIPVKSVRECVDGAEIISTQTPVRSPIVKLEWIAQGTHINAIGADAPGKQELDPEILKRAKVVVDDWEQASHSGEINVPLANRMITKDDLYGEIGEIVAGRKPGRTSEEEITIFDSTGLAVQDVATAWRVYELAKARGIGQWLEFF